MSQGRGHADFMYHQFPSSSGAMLRGARGQRSFGAGATAARGAKRKAMASGGGEVSQMVDGSKKTNPMDSWQSPPIAQQPLNSQMLNLMDGVGMGDGDWYHDTYPGDIAYNSAQHW